MARFIGTDATTGPSATPAVVGEESQRLVGQLSGQLTGQADSFGFDGEQIIDLATGSDLGGVTIARLLAEGGMGRVYEGRQHVPARPVAVKVLRDGLASRGMMKRFEQEAHLLARLRHPHIAQVYTAGTCRHGSVTVPFFVMELVEGALPIDRFVRDHAVPVRQRVQLVRRVAGAVAYGHRLGIVHRDLKPGNILVDANGEPKVIDFGVALVTDADLAFPTLQTDAGKLVGTLRYMSPEQFDADSSRIDARTDVYALGLVLHELLTGDLPYDVRGQPIVVAARMIREQEPQPEAKIARALSAAVDVRAPERRQLAAITETCLQKRPADRYATAADLEDELSRWLAGEPIRARPATVVERTGRLLRRHRLSVAATAGIILAGVVAAFFFGRARQQELRAERHRVGEQAESYYAIVQRAATAAERRNIPIATSLLERARAIDAVGGRPIEIDCLTARLDDSIAMLQGDGAIVRAVAASAAGDTLATGDDRGVVRIWDVDRAGWCRELHRLSEHRGPLWAAAFSPNGRLLVTGAENGEAIVWDAAVGEPCLRLKGHAAAIYAAAWAPDGGGIATASGDGSVILWDAERGEQRTVFRPDWQGSTRDRNIYGIAFSARGDRLAAACGDGLIRIWNVANGEPLPDLRGHQRRVFAVAFSPDDRRLASAAEDGTARLWDLETGTMSGLLRHPLRVNAVAWTADGTGLVTVSADTIVRLWATTGDTVRQDLVGHRDVVWSLARLQAGRFVTTSADGTTRVWDTSDAQGPVLSCGSEGGIGVRGVACSPDGRLVATATAQGRVRLWDLATCTATLDLPTIRSRVNAVDFSPSGDLLVAAGGDGVVRLYTVSTGAEAARFALHTGPAFAAVFSPDGRRIATAGAEVSAMGDEKGAVRIVSSTSATERVAALPHPARVYGVSWSPDGRRLVTACADGVVREWNAGGGELLGEHRGHDDDVNWVTFSRDGSRIATASSDGTVRLWNPRDRWSSMELTGPVGQVWEVAFSPDGSRIVAGGADGSLHLWQTGSGRHLLSLDGHGGAIWGVAFSADGGCILTGADDGAARAWGLSVAEIHRRRSDILP